MLPKDFGHWETVYGAFRRWRREGVWQRVMTELRQVERRCQGRLAEPSAGTIDSQSVKTATQSQDVGFDRHKKIKGRMRHLLVDTLGLIVAVVVTAANVDDRQGLRALFNSYFAEGVVYLLVADNVSRLLPIRLHRVNQPVISSRNRFSTPHATLLT
jgi:putative transposase